MFIAKKVQRIIFGAVLVFAPCLFALSQPVSLLYVGSSPESVRDFMAHSAQIGLAVPTWYQVGENGLLTGAPNPAVLERAHSEKLPVMPLIALFSKKNFHTLASSARAQEQMNQALLREARRYAYIGFQIDFENIDWTDRDLLTGLVKQTAAVLHKNGLQLSIATVPNAPGYPGAGEFSKWIYTDWRGAYDLAEIGKAVDLVCLMTYDQHTHWTMPGPVAGWQWTVENLEYALKVVPKEKLSLGIPFYGYHWYTGGPTVVNGEEKPHPMADSISAPNAALLADTYKSKLQWDEQERSTFYYFERDQMREWVYYTDARTFEARYRLVEEKGLQGFCAWVLGEEDPEIWKILPQRTGQGSQIGRR